MIHDQKQPALSKPLHTLLVTAANCSPDVLRHCKFLIGCYLIKITGCMMGSVHVRRRWRGIWNLISLLQKRILVYQRTHSHHYIRKALEYTTFQVAKHPWALYLSHTWLLLSVCECVFAGLKQLCVTDKPCVTLRQTNFLNLWQPSDSSLYLFRLLSKQVTHRGLWNKQYFLSKWINNHHLHTHQKMTEFSI